MIVGVIGAWDMRRMVGQRRKQSQANHPFGGRAGGGHLSQEPVRHDLRDEAEEVRPGVRPPARKNRGRICWNTLRISSRREPRRWLRIIRRSRTVHVRRALSPYDSRSFCCKRGYAAVTGSLAVQPFDILHEYASGLRASECSSRFTSARFRDEPS